MGSFSSGRGSYASTGTVEQARRIDIRYMKKRGLLRPGLNGTLNWNRGGTPQAKSVSPPTLTTWNCATACKSMAATGKT